MGAGRGAPRPRERLRTRRALDAAAPGRRPEEARPHAARLLRRGVAHPGRRHHGAAVPVRLGELRRLHALARLLAEELGRGEGLCRRALPRPVVQMDGEVREGVGLDGREGPQAGRRRLRQHPARLRETAARALAPARGAGVPDLLPLGPGVRRRGPRGVQAVRRLEGAGAGRGGVAAARRLRRLLDPQRLGGSGRDGRDPRAQLHEPRDRGNLVVSHSPGFGGGADETAPAGATESAGTTEGAE